LRNISLISGQKEPIFWTSNNSGQKETTFGTTKNLGQKETTFWTEKNLTSLINYSLLDSCSCNLFRLKHPLLFFQMNESEARIDDEDTTRTIQNSETVLSNGENGTEESEEDRPSRNLYDLSNYSDTETVNDKQ
jgi:hypothetical protein